MVAIQGWRTPGQVARLLGKSRAEVLALIEHGPLCASLLPQGLRVHSAALEAFQAKAGGAR